MSIKKEISCIFFALLFTIIIDNATCNVSNDRRRFFSRERIQMAIKYLKKFGYIKKGHVIAGEDQSHMQEEFIDGLKRLQYFSSLNVTGVVDDETKKLMETGRCGNDDPPVVLPGERTKRFYVTGARWHKKTLVWRLINSGKSLTTEQVRRAIKIATDLWSEAANINFQEQKGSEEVDMWIKFGSKNHQCAYSFDGPDGVLGHAFYPDAHRDYAGDIHFDDDEKFVFQTKDGYDIVQVMIHEMGHALGMGHSMEKRAIMFPFQERGKFNKDIKLHLDDAKGFQKLYGKPKPKLPTKPPTVAKIFLPPCPKSTFDAVYFFPSYKLYVAITMSRQVYFIANHGKIRSGPKRVEKYFSADKLKGRIDASFISGRIHPRYNLTVLFSGKTYYIYNVFGYFSGPHSIHSRFEKDGRTRTPLEMVLPPWVRKVDAVLPQTNGDLYVFCGQWFWDYSIKERRFKRGYPQYIKNVWKGLPKNIHAAFALPNGYFVMMYKNKFYQIEKNRKRVAKGFPVKLHEWIQCTPK